MDIIINGEIIIDFSLVMKLDVIHFHDEKVCHLQQYLQYDIDHEFFMIIEYI